MVPHGDLDRCDTQLPRDGLRRLRVGHVVRPVRHARGRACRRRPARPRADDSEPGHQPRAVPAAVRRAGRPRRGQLLCADDRHDDALVHRQPQPCRGARLGRPGHGIASRGAALPCADLPVRLAHRHAPAGRHRVDRCPARGVPPAPTARGGARRAGRRRRTRTSSPWRRRCGRRSSPPSRSRISPAALRIPDRSSIWSAMRSTAEWRR